MRPYRLSPSLSFCLGFLVFVGCAPQPLEAEAQASPPPLQQGMARLWVLRQPSAPEGNVAGADPIVYANGAALARSAQGTGFFHDFPPGTYSPTVQSFGTPTTLVA